MSWTRWALGQGISGAREERATFERNSRNRGSQSGTWSDVLQADADRYYVNYETVLDRIEDGDSPDPCAEYADLFLEAQALDSRLEALFGRHPSGESLCRLLRTRMLEIDAEMDSFVVQACESGPLSKSLRYV